MTTRKVALVTGANKGIGYGIVTGLAALGWSVGLGARDSGRLDDAVRALSGDGVDVFGVHLDVTDVESIRSAVALVRERHGRLDVLVNNAGAVGDRPDLVTELSPATLERVIRTNVIGLIETTNAFLPLLRLSEDPRIINQSSHVASSTMQADPEVDFGGALGIYAPSKAMVNALTVQYAKELAAEGFVVDAVAPGYVATELNGFSGTQSIEEGAAVAIDLATRVRPVGTGGFLDVHGPLPW